MTERFSVNQQPVPSDDVPIALNLLGDYISRFTKTVQDPTRSERERNDAKKELADVSYMHKFVNDAQDRMRRGVIKNWRDDIETVLAKSSAAEEKARQEGNTQKAEKIWQQYEIISKYYSRLTPEELKKHAEIYMKKSQTKLSEQRPV